jgi:hypothetical protein
MDVFNEMAARIIKEQELIIGPVAWKEAAKVDALHVEVKQKTVAIAAENGMQAINDLVSQYEHFFGRAAQEVCKEAAASIIADLNPTEVPSSLR